MSKLDQVVYTIENGQIVECTLRDFVDGSIDETTTPHGIGPRYHLRGLDLWTWGHAGNNPCCINTFDTEADAIAALEDTFAADVWNNPELVDLFPDRELAEAFIRGE